MIDTTIWQKKMLVAFDTYQDYQTILDIAASLAIHQSAELSALFVEDINLFHLAGLPFSREIDRISSNEQPIDQSKISRDLENQAKHIRQRLADVKKHSRLEIKFTVVRGHYLSEALAAAANADILLLDKRRKKQKTTTTRQSRKNQFIQPVWVIFDGSEAAERALMISGELLKARRAALNIVLKAEAKEKSVDQEKRARSIIKDFNVNTHFFIIQNNEFASVMQSITQRGCSIMIMSVNRGNAEFSNHQAAVFSKQIECPVLLIA